MFWHHEILFGLVTRGWVQRAETLRFALSHSHRWGSPESPSAVSGCQRKLLIILFFILSNSALLSDCYWRLIWKQSEGRPLISIQYGSLAWWQEHLSFWHCLWQYPGAALSPLSFPPAQRLVSTARTCILSAPYLSNHPSPSSTLPSQSDGSKFDVSGVCQLKFSGVKFVQPVL